MTLMNNNDQSNNSIGAGNIINGNLSNNGEINNIANQIFFHPPSRAISNIEKVYNELKSKIKNNEDISDHLDYINHYLFRYTNISKTDLRSLDKKLIDANREDDIEEALYFKESAAKFIMKYQQNTSVQYIIASILALIKKDFMHYITRQSKT